MIFLQKKSFNFAFPFIAGSTPSNVCQDLDTSTFGRENIWIFLLFEHEVCPETMSFLGLVLLLWHFVMGSKPKRVDFQLLMIPCLCGTVLAHVSFSKHWESVCLLEKTMLDASLKFKSFFVFASRFYSKSEVCKKSKKQIIKIWCWLLVKFFSLWKI